MPRKERVVYDGYPHHVILRGNNKQNIFMDTSDFGVMNDFILEALDKYNCNVLAFVYMSNHIHLVLVPEGKFALSGFVKSFSQRYVQYFNKKYGRTGTLWEGRFRSSAILNDAYLLACIKYIELNPVRACIVVEARQYLWSSYRFNKRGKSLGGNVACGLVLDLVAADGYEEYVMGVVSQVDLEKVNLIRQSSIGNNAIGEALRGSDP